MSRDCLVVSEQIGNFLENKSYKTGREKVAFMASLYEAERNAENPLVLEEEDYDIIIRILNGADFVVDTGKFFVNVGAPIGREEFLCAIDVSYDAEGNRLIEWGLDTLDNAYLFSKEDLESIVPEAFRGSSFTVLERVAHVKRGRGIATTDTKESASPEGSESGTLYSNNEEDINPFDKLLVL